MNKKFVAIPSFIMYVTHKCVYIIEHPRKYYRYSLLMRFLFRFSRYYSDKKYLLKIFPLFTGYKLDLDNPKTFNEKLQWLKLYYHKPEFSSMVDKAEAKNYAARIIGEGHIIPTLAIYNKVDEIDFDSLPEQFVLKCTHDSGDLVICKDKSTIDQEKALKKLSKGLKFNYYHMGKEWVYKNVKPRVIAEKYLSNDGEELKDYKIQVSHVKKI